MHDVVFGFGAHSGIEDGPELLRMAEQADRDGLDIFSLSDHPYLGDRLDAYATIGFVLGRTTRLAGFANVTNLPTRPAPMPNLNRPARDFRPSVERAPMVITMTYDEAFDQVAEAPGGGSAHHRHKRHHLR